MPGFNNTKEYAKYWISAGLATSGKNTPFYLLQAHIHKWTIVLPTLNFSKFTLQFSETKVTCSATDK